MSVSDWSPINHTRFEKYGTAVRSRIKARMRSLSTNMSVNMSVNTSVNMSVNMGIREASDSQMNNE